MVWRSSSVAFVVSEPNLRLSAALPVTEFFCTPELRDAFIFLLAQPVFLRFMKRALGIGRLLVEMP